jgi:hypothetical protein
MKEISYVIYGLKDRVAELETFREELGPFDSVHIVLLIYIYKAAIHVLKMELTKNRR